MTASMKCPVCENKFGGKANIYPASDRFCLVRCSICGTYNLAEDVLEDYFAKDGSDVRGEDITSLLRTQISHTIRRAQSGKSCPTIDAELMQRFLKHGIALPTPSLQTNKLIGFIGDYVSRNGKTLPSFPDFLYAEIGSSSPYMLGELANELEELGLIKGQRIDHLSKRNMINVNLTLDGWDKYETIRKGGSPGSFAFLALKFGESDLDELVQEHMKPYIKSRLGFDLRDMRDLAKAGVIDNIMREHIRDSAFVIADLTHDNSGAYWEAGYAEGLGKPVIYICEDTKFKAAQTHFDTNHCTTVMWNSDNVEKFKHELVATIRRSLNLF